MAVDIGIALEGRGQFELLVDPGQARGDQGGEGQVGVEVGPADPAFDADRFAALGAQAKAGGAIVQAPDGSRGCKGAGLEALIGVDVGREKTGDVVGVLELPGHPGTHQF